MFTPYWNALGLPALTVPMGLTGEHLPVGLQIAGPAFHEDVVLRAGDAYQTVTDWHLRVPPTPTATPA
jgi:aspartyl-tRNA(Asn)/glutamyl-tRNA(Gln) amidotransferase subunit A